MAQRPHRRPGAARILVVAVIASVLALTATRASGAPDPPVAVDPGTASLAAAQSVGVSFTAVVPIVAPGDGPEPDAVLDLTVSRPDLVSMSSTHLVFTNAELSSPKVLVATAIATVPGSTVAVTVHGVVVSPSQYYNGYSVTVTIDVVGASVASTTSTPATTSTSPPTTAVPTTLATTVAGGPPAPITADPPDAAAPDEPAAGGEQPTTRRATTTLATTTTTSPASSTDASTTSTTTTTTTTPPTTTAADEQAPTVAAARTAPPAPGSSAVPWVAASTIGVAGIGITGVHLRRRAGARRSAGTSTGA